jgi:GNAT superfamily N-acetyltransferase
MGSHTPLGDVILIPKKTDLPPDVLPDIIERFKTTRLTALQLDPAAFGSNYAHEIQFTYETWLSRATNPLGKTFVSLNTSNPIAPEVLDKSYNDPSLSYLLHDEWLGTVTLLGPKVLANARSDLTPTPFTIFTPGNSNDPPDLESLKDHHAVYLIVAMFVRPGQRRVGRGRRLVEAALAAAIEEARNVSASRVTIVLNVESENRAARGLYQTVGFEECDADATALTSSTLEMKWERDLL